MPTTLDTCPLWGQNHVAEGERDISERVLRVSNSDRAAGGYELTLRAKERNIDHLSLEEKARLTTWLIDQRMQGIEFPRITEDIVELAKRTSSLPVHERAERLLRFIAEQTKPVGTPYHIREKNDAVYAWSESIGDGEVGHLITYLMKEGWIESQPQTKSAPFGEYRIPAYIIVTVDGDRRVATRRTNVDSSQAFVAMWFGDSMNETYDNGIKAAIKDAGYSPLRIDQKEHINRIEDEIIAEIRRSRFVIADFTHGKDGARGGVYYEAGFAHGLGLPVIFTCHKEALETLHFDTSHYSHIAWTDPADLYEKLKNRILAVIGRGPTVPYGL